jgi:hypothetical protein
MLSTHSGVPQIARRPKNNRQFSSRGSKTTRRSSSAELSMICPAEISSKTDRSDRLGQAKVKSVNTEDVRTRLAAHEPKGRPTSPLRADDCNYPFRLRKGRRAPVLRSTTAKRGHQPITTAEGGQSHAPYPGQLVHGPDARPMLEVKASQSFEADANRSSKLPRIPMRNVEPFPVARASDELFSLLIQVFVCRCKTCQSRLARAYWR